MITIKQLRLVRAVADEGSLTRAARRLFVTQPALTHQLQQLERQLGVAVFHRMGKRLVATAAGERLLRSAHTLLGELDDLEEELRRHARGSAGRLRVSTQCYTCYHWLPQVLPEYQREYPDVDFRIVTEASTCVEEWLLRGELDVGLLYDVVDEERLEVFALFEDEQVLIVAPSHPLAAREYVQAEDFAELDLLLYYHSPQHSSLFTRVLTPRGIAPASITEVRMTEGIVALVAAGVGVSVLTRWSVAPQIREGRVVALRVTEQGLIRRWHAAVRRQANVPRYLSDFITLLQRGPDRLFDRAQSDRAFAGITPIAAAS